MAGVILADGRSSSRYFLLYYWSNKVSQGSVKESQRTVTYVAHTDTLNLVRVHQSLHLLPPLPVIPAVDHIP